MLTQLEQELPVKRRKLNGRIITFGFLMCGTLALYAQSTQPKLINLSDNHPANYKKTLEELSDKYLQLAQVSINTPGTKCYKQSINDCFEYLKPESPQELEGSTIEDSIKFKLRRHIYETRMDAIKIAKIKAQGR